MENYRNALSEVYYIINYMENNTSKLIPIEVYEEIKNNMNKDYKITKKDILEKNISETARACLSVIYTEYLCTEEERKKWNELDKLYSLEQAKVNGFIDEYLHIRKNIALIILLIDIRHEPGSNDKMMYDYIIRSGLPFMVITSKADKIAVTKVDAAVDSIQSILNPIKDFTFLPFSAERKIYTDDVWKDRKSVV